MAVNQRLETRRIDTELLPIDRQILRLLLEGRCTPGYIADQIGEQQPWVSQRLSMLVDEEIVTKVHRGLYELADDYKREVCSDG